MPPLELEPRGGEIRDQASVGTGPVQRCICGGKTTQDLAQSMTRWPVADQEGVDLADHLARHRIDAAHADEQLQAASVQFDAVKVLRGRRPVQRSALRPARHQRLRRRRAAPVHAAFGMRGTTAMQCRKWLRTGSLRQCAAIARKRASECSSPSKTTKRRRPLQRWLRRSRSGAGVAPIRPACGTRACGCRSRSCRRSPRTAAPKSRSRWRAWPASAPCPRYRP